MLPEADERSLSQVGGRGLKNPRSPEWAYQAVEYLKMKWRHIDIDYERFLGMVSEIVTNRSWELIPTDKPYGDIDTMFQAELGVCYNEVLDRVRMAEKAAGTDLRNSMTTAMIAAKPALTGDDLAAARAEGGKKGAEFGKEGGRGNRKPLGRSPTKGFAREQDRGTEYFLRRLARLDLDTGSTWIARYKAGEFPSVAATGRAAGIPIGRQVKLGNPETVAKAIVRIMGEEYAAEIVSAIRNSAPPREDADS